MRSFEACLDKINFKKAVRIYITVSIILLVLCAAAAMYITRDKIRLAIDYSKISESFRHNGFSSDLRPQLNELSAESKDIVNCIVVDKDSNIIYKANTNLLKDSSKFSLIVNETDKRYVRDNINSNVIYKVVREENIVFNRDYIANHQRIISDIDANLYYEKDLENKNINLINYLVNKQTKEKLFIIRNAEAIPYAETLFETVGAIVGFIFIFYWIGTALWVYRDANSKKCNPALWGMLALLTNLVGVIIYIMYKQTNKVCYKCGSLQNKDNAFCNCCGAQINERCSSCTSIVNKGQNYCGRCGHKL